MSHELRTPLTAILGFNQLLGMDGETLTDDHRHAVDQIAKAGGHLLTMIDEVLDIARIEAGGHALALEALDPTPLLADVRNLIAPQAHAAGVEVRIENDTKVDVMGDRRAMVQILLNLLSNAIKYGPDGGTVTVSLVETSDRVRIEVMDEGPGVPAELVERLFVPFDRLDAERWSGTPGSGLGLALSRGLAQAQGGDVAYRPRDDRQGAVFALELPPSPTGKGNT